MTSLPYTYRDVNGVSIAYTDAGEGQPILFIHGFASSSFTWKKLIASMPRGFRFITIDLKGFGYSEKLCDDLLSPFDQSVLVSEFITQLRLDNFILVGHSLGGAISILSLFNERISSKVRKLVLVDSAGSFQKLPDFINDLAATPLESTLVKMAQEEFLVSTVLQQSFFNVEKIDPEAVSEYSHILRQDKAKECLLAAARQIAIPRTKSFQEKLGEITIPTLIVWGREDAMIGLAEAHTLMADLRKAELKVIANCGHSPQEETPAEAAKLITEFISPPSRTPPAKPQDARTDDAGKSATRPALLGKQSRTEQLRKVKMRRLIDRWSVGTILMILFIKFLQLLKRIGFKAKMNGWRKVTGIFLRREHSKFILACFRLNYLGTRGRPEGMEEAKAILTERLADFLRRSPACHWTLEWGFFISKREKLQFTDVVEAVFGADGMLLKLKPYFDTSCENLTPLGTHVVERALDQLLEAYNATRHLHHHKRAWVIYKKLLRWARATKDLPPQEHMLLQHLVERLANSTFIQFEALPNDPALLSQSRMAAPYMRHCSSPGLGLLNIVCRFTADYLESDVWFQYHHVPVDGLPMQEMLQELKKEWGEAGKVTYPPLPHKDAELQFFAYGSNLFRARIFVSFERFLLLRKFLNEKYYAEMGGPATISGMLIWGVAQQSYFQERKFAFPVDTSLLSENATERNISVIFIRPKKFRDNVDPLQGFLRYQREFNQRVSATRLGQSESYELLELYALMHPMFYQFARYLMPKTMGEFVGTAGLSIL